MYNSANQDKVLQRTTPSITPGNERERGEEKVREMNGMEKQQERIGGGGTVRKEGDCEPAKCHASEHSSHAATIAV